MTRVVITPPAAEPVSIADVMHHCRIDASNQEPAPGSISVALGSGAGDVNNGVHRYLCTFITADGETQAGDISAAITITNNAVTGKVSLSNIPLGGYGVTGRKIYRTIAGGSTYLFLATIVNNTATTYTDNIADASLGAQAPIVNTTADPMLRLFIASARQYAETLLKRSLITQTVEQYFDSLGSGFRMGPIQSVESITYTDENGDTQTLEADQYLVDTASIPARISAAYGVTWPAVQVQNNAVKIRYVVGYGDPEDVPECIKHWMLIRIKTLYETRDLVSTTFQGMVLLSESYVDRLLDSEIAWGI